MQTSTLFLHGLDSLSRGTKGRFFTENFPGLIAPDFTGSLQDRMQALETICDDDHLLRTAFFCSGLA